MIWSAIVLGFLLTLFGASAGAALIASSRTTLADAVSRRLRGGSESLEWVAGVERELIAAAATTSLGIILVGAASTALFGGASLLEVGALLLLVSVPVMLFSGYLLPRWLTESRAERVADWLSPILRPWGRLLGLVLPARGVAKPSELRALWREGAAVGFAPDHELVMVGGVVNFMQRPVREAMTPRTDLIAVEEHTGFTEICRVFTESGYTRVPVYRGSLDEIIGMVHAFDLFKLRAGDPLPIRPVSVAPASRSCGDLLLDMQRERRHLAVILDEFGGTLGMATLEDLLEALVGEIYDEHDIPPVPARQADPGLFETDGTIAASEVAERFGTTLPGSAGSIAGRLVELAGRIPVTGERFLLSGLEFDVLQSTPTRIERLLVRRASPTLIPLMRPTPQP